MDATKALPIADPVPLARSFKPAADWIGPLARIPRGGRFTSRQLRALDNYRHLHRLFQVTLGVLMAQHPKLKEACGEPVRWTYSVRFGGGYTFEGPRGKFVLVPSRDGAYCLNRSAPELVRAMDDLVGLMVAQAEESAPAAAAPSKEGNAIARGWFYLMRGIEERDYVVQYVRFMSAKAKAQPLSELFNVYRD